MKKTALLVAIATLVLVGCSKNSLHPNFNRNNIGGEINPNSNIPLCGKGNQTKWVAQSIVNEPKIIDGKLYSHNKGFGIEQRACKKANGNILLFLVEKEVDETEELK